jgi:hypothetical protein
VKHNQIISVGVLFFCSIFSSFEAFALDLDWSGQFRAESHYLKNYSLDSSAAGETVDAARLAAKGYYIPGGGNHNAQYQMLFMRLTPKVIVNDNINIKSEWWLSNPIYGYFGSNYPYQTGGRLWSATEGRGSLISLQRLWGEFQTDVGLLQVGRAPLNWGLGIVWNSGDGLWDRFQSTGDTIRFISKFGAFSIIPAATKYSFGNSVGGACVYSLGGCSVAQGGQGISDYSLALRYNNIDEDFDTGVNFIRRLAGGQQDPASGMIGPSGALGTGANYSTWDIYLRKRVGMLTFAGEFPIMTGNAGGADYKTFALAGEVKVKPSDVFELTAKLGSAPGNPNIAVGATPNENKVFRFHPNYRLGLIMFNYNLANVSGVQSNNNPTSTLSNAINEDPIMNARYLMAQASYQLNRWMLRSTFVTAQAAQVAKAGEQFFNHREFAYVTNATGTDQSSSLGFEIDLGAEYRWDDHAAIALDLGAYMPGKFYAFSNTAVANETSTVLAGVLKVGVNF